MDDTDRGPDVDALLKQLLGYLNFSSGAEDPQFLKALDTLFQQQLGTDEETLPVPGQPTPPAPWRQIVRLLRSKLQDLHGTEPTFEKIDQAESVLMVVADHLIQDYFDFHRDLLFHQNEAHLIGPFFLGRVFQAALREGPPFNDPAQATQQIIGQLNDFIGHRPVATLESVKVTPRANEWVRPIPIYIDQAGLATSEYTEIVGTALNLLSNTDDDLLQAAYFDPSHLSELAYDPRAYDFDHPVNKRPNYHFGEWDPHEIDNKGNYRRFVIREVTLQAILERVSQSAQLRIPRDELVFEAGAVLAGTILMASGISGAGPETHDSNTTLTNLIPRIATYRDVFYERLIDGLQGNHADRLIEEAKKLRQPFGGARQHLNTYLSRERSSQLEHARLARVFARMGYLGAAQRQADAIRVASSRMVCRVDCAVTATHQALATHDRAAAMKHIERIVDLIHRGIHCGAIVDPWNILGFDANFSLFPALENSVRDRRIDDLVQLMGRLFDLFSRLWSNAAAADDRELSTAVEVLFDRTAQWWQRFAAHEVSAVDAESAVAEFDAARDVASALRDWHLRGAASGDVAFWAPHVASFESPKAYALVVETLLARQDLVSSMSLLIHWLGQAPNVALTTQAESFSKLATQWVTTAIRQARQDQHTEKEGSSTASSAWQLLRKFFDYIEANADEYWTVPTYDAGPSEKANNGGEHSGQDDADDESEGLYDAAYENVVFKDSTDDGFEGAVFDEESFTDTEREKHAENIVERLSFLAGVAELWTLTAASVGSCKAAGIQSLDALDDYRETLRSWYRSASQMRRELFRLIGRIADEKLQVPEGDHESMVAYDRRRLLKETLIEHAVSTVVDVAEAERFLLAALRVYDAPFEAGHATEETVGRELDESATLLTDVMRQDGAAAETKCRLFLTRLSNLQILFVPMSKGGNPLEMAKARIRLGIVENLLVALPRLGLLTSTIDVINAAREMEHNVPGRGAVTQFDELYKVGFREMVDALVRATSASGGYLAEDDRDADTVLVQCLERLTEPALEAWLLHSRTLRLSVLERVQKPTPWKKLVDFIQSYGSDLFTQRFLTLGNIRAILHCGPETWLREVLNNGGADMQLFEALEAKELETSDAAEQLGLVLDAIVENYDEYRDYNSTTTQSDRGELLYMLLDFIRLRIEYDRVAWNLRPVVWAHEVLVRRGRNAAAQIWRRMLAERIGEEATRYQRRLTRLQKKYAMRMATVSQRIGERFLLPMTIDRMLALVRPAVEQVDQPDQAHAFEILEEETELLLRDPSGAGMDGPEWLLALQREVEQVNYSGDLNAWPGNELLIQPLRPNIDDIHTQLDQLQRGD